MRLVALTTVFGAIAFAVAAPTNLKMGTRSAQHSHGPGGPGGPGGRGPGSPGGGPGYVWGGSINNYGGPGYPVDYGREYPDRGYPERGYPDRPYSDRPYPSNYYGSHQPPPPPGPPPRDSYGYGYGNRVNDYSRGNKPKSGVETLVQGIGSAAG